MIDMSVTFFTIVFVLFIVPTISGALVAAHGADVGNTAGVAETKKKAAKKKGRRYKCAGFSIVVIMFFVWGFINIYSGTDKYMIDQIFHLTNATPDELINVRTVTLIIVYIHALIVAKVATKN